MFISDTKRKGRTCSRSKERSDDGHKTTLYLPRARIASRHRFVQQRI